MAIKRPLKPENAAPMSLQQANEEFAKIEVLIEQINHHYQMYLAGIERLPPTEIRNRLEKQMHVLSETRRNTALKFRWNTLHSHFVSAKDRWDRIMRDLESGKIQRRNPKNQNQGPQKL